MVGYWLVALLGMTAAAGALAWRLPRLGRDRRWSAGARALGLVVSGDRRAWGQLGGHELAVRWTDGAKATLTLATTGGLERLSHARARVGSEAEECARIGLVALEELPHAGRLALTMSARAGHEARLLADVARLAVRIADELGWGTPPRRTEPPAPERRGGDRLVARLAELRARAPAGTLHRG